jgi:hypothetical protein
MGGRSGGLDGEGWGIAHICLLRRAILVDSCCFLGYHGFEVKKWRGGGEFSVGAKSKEFLLIYHWADPTMPGPRIVRVYFSF